MEGGDSLFSYNAAGELIASSKGHGAGTNCAAPTGASKVSMSYDNLGRLVTTDFADSATPDIHRSYDANSNLLTLNRGSANWSYAYDELGQLIRANGPRGAGSFSYDDWGNMIRKTLGGRDIRMSHDGRNRLVSYSDSRGENKSLSYDARGNVIRLGSQHFVYDMAYQPCALSGKVNGYFRYDGHLRQVKAVQNGETIYNVFDANGSLVHIDNATKNQKTDYIKAAGMTLARLVNVAPTYMHPDYLGSAVVGCILADPCPYLGPFKSRVLVFEVIIGRISCKQNSSFLQL